ncbi:hypothetical protein J8247_09400 [Corynebacterium tuberculostearicum]|nr:hypothetical protein J8247_09400 [Corynebacterium tuberculostearicum]
MFNNGENAISSHLMPIPTLSEWAVLLKGPIAH